MTTVKTTHSEATDLMRNTRENEFLFGVEVKNFIDQLFKKGLELERTNVMLEKEFDDTKRNNLIEKQRLVFDWFEAQFKVASDLFGKYLKVNEY